MTANPDAPLDKRGQFIAARKRDLFAALVADLGLRERHHGALDKLYQLFTAVVHYEHLGDRERLHDAYYYLNPAALDPAQPPGGREAAYDALVQILEQVLARANFVEVTREEIERAHSVAGRLRHTVRTGASDFRAVRLFRRGQHEEQIELRSWWGLKREKITLDIYDEVVLFAALKPTPPPSRRFRKRKPLAPPGSVMIKSFQDIAIADIEAVYPNVRVVMNNKDRLLLGVPALLGGIPIAVKLAPALLVLYGLLRFYLGEQAPGADSMGEALIVASALVAVGGFMMNQWVKYEHNALRYQKAVNDTIYFRNVSNNIGVLDHIIGTAEEQDCKEVLLAYFFLLAEGPMTAAALDGRIEAWLASRFDMAVDFEIGDALRKLTRLGVVTRDGEMLSVLPPAAALAALDRGWDGLFQFRKEMA